MAELIDLTLLPDELSEGLKHTIERAWNTQEQQEQQRVVVEILDTLSDQECAYRVALEQLQVGKKRARSPEPAKKRSKKQRRAADANFQCAVCYDLYAPPDMVQNHCPKCSLDQPLQLCKGCHARWRKQCHRTNLCINNCSSEL